MQEEIWKDIPGYEGIYQLSNNKRIKALKRYSECGRLLNEKILKPTYIKNTYPVVWLSKNKKVQGVYVDNLYYKLFEKEGN